MDNTSNSQQQIPPELPVQQSTLKVAPPSFFKKYLLLIFLSLLFLILLSVVMRPFFFPSKKTENHNLTAPTVTQKTQVEKETYTNGYWGFSVKR